MICNDTGIETLAKMLYPNAPQVSFEQLTSLQNKSSAERRQFWKTSKRLARGTLVSTAILQALSSCRQPDVTCDIYDRVLFKICIADALSNFSI